MIDQKHLECVEYFYCLGSLITDDARGTREIKSKIAIARAAFNKYKSVSISISDCTLRKKLGECYAWIIAFHGAENWALRKVDRKYLGSFEMCWRGMEKISWTDRLSNEEALQRVKEERNILRTIKRRKAKWIGHILRRNCIKNHVTDGKIEGRIEVARRRGKRRK
jgi:hypothetical protein